MMGSTGSWPAPHSCGAEGRYRGRADGKVQRQRWQLRPDAPASPLPASSSIPSASPSAPSASGAPVWMGRGFGGGGKTIFLGP